MISYYANIDKLDEITLLIDDNWTKNKTKKKKEGKRLEEKVIHNDRVLYR